jgi:hypothetical protein
VFVFVSASIERRVLDSVEQGEATRKTFAGADAATNAAYAAAIGLKADLVRV